MELTWLEDIEGCSYLFLCESLSSRLNTGRIQPDHRSDGDEGSRIRITAMFGVNRRGLFRFRRRGRRSRSWLLFLLSF